MDTASSPGKHNLVPAPNITHSKFKGTRTTTSRSLWCLQHSWKVTSLSAHFAISAALCFWDKACQRENPLRFKAPRWLWHTPQTRQLPTVCPFLIFLIWLATHSGLGASVFFSCLEHPVLFQPISSHPGKQHFVPGRPHGHPVEKLCKSYYLYCIKKDLLELETHNVVGFFLISGLFTS